jgi:hypothetical protein
MAVGGGLCAGGMDGGMDGRHRVRHTCAGQRAAAGVRSIRTPAADAAPVKASGATAGCWTADTCGEKGLAWYAGALVTGMEGTTASGSSGS